MNYFRDQNDSVPTLNFVVFLVSDSQTCLATEKVHSGLLFCHEICSLSQYLPVLGRPEIVHVIRDGESKVV